MSKREAATVTLVSILVLAPVLVGLYLFPANAGSSIGIPGCQNEHPVASRSLTLTPSEPVLMQRCDVLQIFQGIQFTVGASVDLRGSYVGNASLGEVIVFLDVISPSGQYSFYWGSAGGPSGANVTFDAPLFPGTYVFGQSLRCGLGSCETGYVVATESIMVQFDRAVQTTSVPGNLTVAASAYEAWPVAAPENSSGVFIMDAMTTTACIFVLAILPPPVFAAFEADPGGFDFPNASVLESSNTLSCPAHSSPEAVGPPLYGPLNLTVGSELVFFNAGATDGYLWSGPLEVSYLTPGPSQTIALPV